jgi:hypothetical protein
MEAEECQTLDGVGTTDTEQVDVTDGIGLPSRCQLARHTDKRRGARL